MALSRGTSTDYDDLLDKLDEFMVGDHVATVAIAAGGTGFVVGEIITLTDGTSTKAARFIVTSVSSGVIDGIRIWDSGAYSVDPDLTATTSWTSDGSGTGATFDLTMEVSDWTKLKDDATLDSSTERVVMWQETTNDVFIGVRTYTKINGAKTAKNWMPLGFTSYNGGLEWYEQPNLSPSGYDASDGSVLETTVGGAFVPLKDNDTFAMDYWFFVSNRRIMVFAKLVDGVTTTPRYSSMHIGLLNPLGTSSEIPYPMYVAGCTGHWQTAWDDLAPAFHYSGLSQCMGILSRNGPGLFYHNDSAWKSVQNMGNTLGTSNRTERNDYVLYPCGNPYNLADDDEAIIGDNSAALQWENLIRLNNFTAADLELWPTPDSGGDKTMLVPCTVLLSNEGVDVDVAGEIDGLYWGSSAGSTIITSEDTVTDTGVVHRAFQNGVYNQLDGFMFVRET